MTGPAAKATERWAPDEQLIAAVLAGGSRHRMADLSVPDRCWLVAGLTLASMTADDIKDRLSCSLRLVRAIRAEPMTQLCLIYQREVDHFANEMRLAASGRDVGAARLAEIVSERNKLKEQLDRVLDARLVGDPVDTCGRGHLMVTWNVYWHRGRRWCRECHAERQRDYRMARKLKVTPSAIRSAREAGHLEEFVTRIRSERPDWHIVPATASTAQVNRHAATG